MENMINGNGVPSQLPSEELFPYTEALNALIAQYKMRISANNNADEVYKWKLLQDFQDKWDEDAEDFFRMFESLRFANLVYPIGLGVLKHIISTYPEESRANFKMLFNEKIPLQDRIRDFQASNRQLYNEMGFANLSTHQDERSIATYLTFRYPEKYTFYKYSFFKKLTAQLGLKIERTGKIYSQYLSFVNTFITRCIKPDAELLALKDGFLDESFFQDPQHLILAQDILYQTMDKAATATTRKYWRVGSTEGTNGESRWAFMKDRSIVAIGWSDIYNLNEIEDVARKKIYKMMQEWGYYKGHNPTISRKAGEIFNFYQAMKPGDIAVVVEGETILGIGEITGDYEYEKDFKFPHFRAVEWLLPEVKALLLKEDKLKEGKQTSVWQIEKNENITLIDRLITEVKEAKLALTRDLLVSRNLIIYGPPGTGKTYALRNKLFKYFTGTPDDPTEKRFLFTTFHQSLSYEDFVEGIKPEVGERGSGQIKYKVQPGLFRQIVEQAQINPDQPYAIFIDEINRGNVSAIFGELITLLEEDKRKGAPNELTCTLPYSNQAFSVPENLYVIGTMNTADRSVEALDTALRRRFSFVEMLPQPEIIVNNPKLDVDLPKLLSVINSRLACLLDRDHQIGHSYLMGIAHAAEPLEELKKIFANKILPLLQEYFFGSYHKIGAVLGAGFVCRVNLSEEIKFPQGFQPEGFEVKEIYKLANPLDFKTSLPFQDIYAQ